MRILVTGGAGFLGSHLVDFILGYDLANVVDIIDDLSTGSLDNLPLSERVFFLQSSVQTAHIHEIGTIGYLDTIVERCDMIFHLAAVVGVERVLQRPMEALYSNIEATRLVLEAAVHYKKPILIASSSEVYGREPRHRTLLRETDELEIAPNLRWGYAAAKIVDEIAARTLHETAGLQVVIVRLFNTIGPRQMDRYGMVVPRFVTQALNGWPITVIGDGHQCRSFGWVDDVVSAMYRLMLKPVPSGHIFNIGGNEEVSIIELAGLIRKLTSSRSEILNVQSERYDDVRQRVPDLTKLSSVITYSTTMSLAEMLRVIINSHPHNRGVHHV